MQSNEDHSSNIVTADDHRNISTPDETTPLTQSGRELSSPYKYCRYFSPRCFGLIGYFLLLLVEVVTFILRITYFLLTFNLLSLAPSWSGYVYFTHNLLLAHGDSTVFLESEMCKGLDSWWPSIKRNISRLLLDITGDEAIQPKLKRNVSCIWYRF